jgi:transcription antitermination factor NusG
MLDATHNLPSDAHDRMCGQPHVLATPSSRIGWIVVHAYPQAEIWARDNLRQRGYQPYLPMMTAKRRDPVIRSLTHTVQRPLFARYLFVRFPGNWTPIRYCPGVYRIVSAAGKPNMASEAAISAVQAAEALAATPRPGKALWASGDAVSLVAGPFQGHPAVVLSVGSDMALVSLLMFGALREVAVGVDCLKARDE